MHTAVYGFQIVYAGVVKDPTRGKCVRTILTTSDNNGQQVDRGQLIEEIKVAIFAIFFVLLFGTYRLPYTGATEALKVFATPSGKQCEQFRFCPAWLNLMLLFCSVLLFIGTKS